MMTAPSIGAFFYYNNEHGSPFFGGDYLFLRQWKQPKWRFSIVWATSMFFCHQFYFTKFLDLINNLQHRLNGDNESGGKPRQRRQQATNWLPRPLKGSKQIFRYIIHIHFFVLLMSIYNRLFETTNGHHHHPRLPFLYHHRPINQQMGCTAHKNQPPTKKMLPPPLPTSFPPSLPPPMGRSTHEKAQEPSNTDGPWA